MSMWLGAVITVLTSVIASSGFWAFLQRGRALGDARTSLLMGLAHDSIISTGTRYIERGWVSYDEYDDFIKYLWKPYQAFGGNGMAEKIVAAVGDLPFHTNSSYLVRIQKSDKRELSAGSGPQPHHDGPDV